MTTKNIQIANLTRIARELEAVRETIHNTLWEPSDINDEALGKDLTALEQHLDNAQGRLSTVIEDLRRIKRANESVKIDRIKPEQSGDWHDEPLRWAVKGPGEELQKFSTYADAERYQNCRQRAKNQGEAIGYFLGH